MTCTPVKISLNDMVRVELTDKALKWLKGEFEKSPIPMKHDELEGNMYTAPLFRIIETFGRNVTFGGLCAFEHCEILVNNCEGCQLPFKE